MVGRICCFGSYYTTRHLHHHYSAPMAEPVAGYYRYLPRALAAVLRDGLPGASAEPHLAISGSHSQNRQGVSALCQSEKSIAEVPVDTCRQKHLPRSSCGYLGTYTDSLLWYDLTLLFSSSSWYLPELPATNINCIHLVKHVAMSTQNH